MQHYTKGMATATAPMTSEQFLALPQQYDASGNRIKEELIAGEIVRMANPSQLHDIIKNQICRLLLAFLAAHPELGLDTFVEIAYDVSGTDTFAPDVSVVRSARLRQPGERIIPRAPEIAIEVVSPSDTYVHIKAKIRAYLSNGSRAVWVAYPEAKSVEVHTAAGMRELSGEAVIADELLPQFSSPVSAFFE